MLKEALFLRDCRPFLGITLALSGELESSAREPSMPHAFTLSPVGVRRDCLELVRQRRSADAGVADLMPSAAWALGEGEFLFEYALPRQPRWYRLICLDRQLELARFDGHELHAAIAAAPATSPADRPRPLQALLGLIRVPWTRAPVASPRHDRRAEPGGKRSAAASPISPLQCRVIGARGDRFVIDADRVRVLLQRSDDRWHRLADLPTSPSDSPLCAASKGGFVLQVRLPQGQHALAVVEAGEGHEEQCWLREKSPLAELVGCDPPANLVACRDAGGESFVLDTLTGERERLPKLLASDASAATALRLSPSGRYVAQFNADACDRVAVLDRETRASVVITVADVEASSGARGSAPARRLRADVHLLDDALLVLAQGSIARSSFDALLWTAPTAPAPKLKRLKDPAATLDVALRSTALAPIAAQVRSLYAPSIALTPLRQRKDLALGCSKFGGLPDLPAAVDWPRWRHQPMAFIAQFDLAEVHAVAPDIGLPASGLLSCFLALDPETSLPGFRGEANADNAGARVLWTAAESALTRMIEPEDLPAPYRDLPRPVCKLKLSRAGAMLPGLGHTALQLQDLHAAQAQAYAELVELINGDLDDPRHWGSRLGGHPALLRNDDLHLSAECLARGGEACEGRHFTREDPEFQRASLRWRQLLQLAEGNEGWTWGNAGLLHWMVRAQDWSRAEFATAWAIGVER